MGSSPIPPSIKPMKETLIWLNTTYGCGGIIINDNNVVIKSCPLYRWMTGKKFKYVIEILDKKGRLKQYRKISNG